MDGLHRGSNLLFSDSFGFPNFCSCIGVWMACSRMCSSTLFGTRMCSSNFLASRVLRTVSGLVGALVCLIW